MSSGAWVATASDALTALAAAAGATVGGVWTYFRYRRESPDVPRVNATIEAKLVRVGNADYLEIEIHLAHVSGGTLQILRGASFSPSCPTVAISTLRSRRQSGVVAGDAAASVEVMLDQSELGSSEFVREHTLVALGEQSEDTIAYDAELRFVAGWSDDYWTWCANAVVLVDGAGSAVGGSVVGPPPR